MNSREYNQIVEQHSNGLFLFLQKNVRERSVAEDLVQHSFEKLWENRKKILQGKGKSYLFKIAYNAMIDYFRKNKRMYVTEEVPEKVIHPEVNNFELKEWLVLGLNSLTEQYKSLILLRDYEGYSYQEIGEITDLSESQVKVYIFRARKALKEYFLTHHKQEMKSYGYSSK